MFLSNKQKTILLVIILLTAISMGYGFYFFKIKNKTITGGLNINKMTNVDKIYTNSVYGDLYYRITKYQEGQRTAEYSELLPVKAGIGYDMKEVDLNTFSLPKAQILSSQLRRKKIEHFLGEKDDEISQYINEMKLFSEQYAQILATQDQDYFTSSNQAIKKITKHLYNENFKVEPTYIENFYKKHGLNAIPNMQLSYFNENIPFVLVNEAKKGIWQPSIVEFKFNENDRVKVSFLKQYKTGNIEKFISDLLQNSKWWKFNKKEAFDGILIRTIKIENNKPKKLVLSIDGKTKEISAYQMDQNGNVYLIRLYAANQHTAIQSISDFMQLVYGIEFDNNTDTNTHTATSKEIHKHLKSLCENTEKDEEIQEKFDTLKKYELDRQYNLIKRSVSDYCYEKSDLKWDVFLEKFKNEWKDYPNSDNTNKIEIEIENIENIYQVLEEKAGLRSLIFGKFEAAKKLKEECPTIECINKKIKDEE